MKIIENAIEGATVQSLSDEEIVQKIEDNETFSEIDIVFTDLIMGTISGHEVAKYVKSVNPDCYVIILTSNIQATEKDKSFENGADYFLEKPLVEAKLLKAKEAYDER
jgi:CheY-like chemotaxis protein